MKMLMVLGVIIFLFLSGCGKDDKAAATPAPDATPTPAVAQDMGTLSASILPVVAEGTRGISKSRATATYSNAEETDMNGEDGFEMFRLFGDPTLAGGTDGWGVENLRNNLNHLAMLYDVVSQATTTAKSVSTSVEELPFTITVPAVTTVSSALDIPYVFSTYPATAFDYTTGLSFDNNVTISGDTVPLKLYSGWKLGDEFAIVATVAFGSGEGNIYEGSYDTTSGDLRMNRACRTSDGFIVHMELEGNTTSKEFTLKNIKRNTVGGAYNMSVVAKGKVAGTGAHYLVKLATSNTPAEIADVTAATYVWYCISASATSADFEAFLNLSGGNTTPTDQDGIIERVVRATAATDLPTECQTYYADVAATTLFNNDATDASDVAANYTGDLGL